ncbi:hypothetical protein JRQ81_014216 [Phrynocephalus forsythii]|uniref:Uncharacterized protein n=1 Tax=Phrynocephalus forsythii TaxID=171643 RepID=A0A9Q0XX82_9SAUR|nr:hypothetical protein JRQ81_014216 [Phrynocephalus forsythii]
MANAADLSGSLRSSSFTSSINLKDAIRCSGPVEGINGVSYQKSKDTGTRAAEDLRRIDWLQEPIVFRSYKVVVLQARDYSIKNNGVSGVMNCSVGIKGEPHTHNMQLYSLPKVAAKVAKT